MSGNAIMTNIYFLKAEYKYFVNTAAEFIATVLYIYIIILSFRLFRFCRFRYTVLRVMHSE